MNKVLQAIRGVMGVYGVIIWERQPNAFHKLLPARFSDKAVELLCNQLATLSQQSKKLSNIKARFKSGWLWIFCNPNYAVLVMTKADLNTTTMNLVMKSTLATLESQIKQSPTSTGPIAFPVAEFTPDHVIALSRAINLSLGYFQGEVSRFEIAEILRQAKGKLLESYPVLKNFSVDANGGIIVIRGSEKHMDASAVPATAQLIATFVQMIGAKTSTAGLEIERLTVGIAPLLAEIGFYNYFASARRTVHK